MSEVIDWKPARQLRHLASISARALDIDADCGCYFTIHAVVPLAPPTPGNSQQGPPALVLLYRSELIFGNSNPEWEPLDFDSVQLAPVEWLTCSNILITFHQQHTNTLATTTRPISSFSRDGSCTTLPTAFPFEQHLQTTSSSTSIQHGYTGQGDTSPRILPDAQQKLEEDESQEQREVMKREDLERHLKDLPGEILLYKFISLQHIHPDVLSIASLGPVIAANTLVLEFEDGTIFLDPPSRKSKNLSSLAARLQQQQQGSSQPGSRSVSTPVTPFASPKKQLAALSAQVMASTSTNHQNVISNSAPAVPSLSLETQRAPEDDVLSTSQNQAAVEEGVNEQEQLTPRAHDLSSSSSMMTTAATRKTTVLATTGDDNAAEASNSVEVVEPRRRLGFMSRLLGVGTAAATAPGDTATTSAATNINGNNNNALLEEEINGEEKYANTGTTILTTHMLRSQIHTILELRRKLAEAYSAAQKSRTSVAELLKQREKVETLQREVESVVSNTQELTRQVGVVESRLQAAKEKVEEGSRSETVRGQALATTLKVLGGTEKRMHDAQVSLHGSQGTGHLQQLLSVLIARRCYLVAKLGSTFKLGPIAVSVPQAPPGGYLDERLEVGWAGAVGKDQKLKYKAVASDAAGTWKGARSSSLYKQEMRLAIGGLELHPSVWRKAIDADGYDWDAREDKEAGIALGFLAHMIDRIAAYLDVPLRYHIRFQGSTSTILDGDPPVGPWTVPQLVPGAQQQLNAASDVAQATTTSWFGRSSTTTNTSNTTVSNGQSSSAVVVNGNVHKATPPPVEYPLYCLSNRERARFAVGVFLLNKNVIQLLQVHGINASGPNQLLHNVYKLVSAAESAFGERIQ